MEPGCVHAVLTKPRGCVELPKNFQNFLLKASCGKAMIKYAGILFIYFQMILQSFRHPVLK